ncbi:MAG: hypothetical protein ACJAT7_002772, partial [Psychromonas sp.]|uniref:hypothetical protein n=1 Tax=Psychromonas sp. TaxID=1884585 RepID=UPI0039E281F0
WLTYPSVRFKSLHQVTTLHLGSPTRLDMTIEERCAEMQSWLNRINEDFAYFNQFAQVQLLASWNKQITDIVSPIRHFGVVINKLYHELFS